MKQIVFGIQEKYIATITDFIQFSIQSSNLEKQFKKLKPTNIITQIEQNTYFIVFEPTIIHATCNNSNYKIEIFNHTQILKNYECSLSKSYFEYIPFNSSSYSIYIDESENLDKIIHKIELSNKMRNLK